MSNENAQRRREIVTRLAEPLGHDAIGKLQAAEDDVRYLLEVVDDYEKAITWDTTCLNCSNLMDKNYEQYCRLDMIRTALEGKFWIPSEYEDDALMYAEPVRAALEDNLG